MTRGLEMTPLYRDVGTKVIGIYFSESLSADGATEVISVFAPHQQARSICYVGDNSQLELIATSAENDDNHYVPNGRPW